MSNFYRLSAAVPQLQLGDPAANAATLAARFQAEVESGSQLVLFPEQALLGSTAGVLGELPECRRQSVRALQSLAASTRDTDAVMVVGTTLELGRRLVSAMAVLQRGKIRGLVPRVEITGQYSGVSCFSEFGTDVPVGSELLFSAGELVFGILFSGNWDNSFGKAGKLASNGAQLLLVPGNRPETLTLDTDYPAEMRQLSRQLAVAVLACSAGPGESTDRNWYRARICAVAPDQTEKYQCGDFAAEAAAAFLVNPAALRFQRRFVRLSDAGTAALTQRVELSELSFAADWSLLQVDPHPYIPSDPAQLQKRCESILQAQSTMLAARMQRAKLKTLVVGVSGGLDSTLALLSAARAVELLRQHDLPAHLLAVTMPGFGTSSRTKNNAVEIAERLGAELKVIPITAAIKQHFSDLGHDENRRDVVYENSQARERTQILMDLANGCSGLVVGTGDLSEEALGWCTFNGDHMAMYNVNAAVPKTLLREVVRYCGTTTKDAKLAQSIADICATPVSPELVPGQETEQLLGSYELHDFFLFHLTRRGADPAELLALARLAFAGTFGETEISAALKRFLSRFYRQQFKRNVAPDGLAFPDTALSQDAWNAPSDPAPGFGEFQA